MDLKWPRAFLMTAGFAYMRDLILGASGPEALFGDLGADPRNQADNGHQVYRQLAKAVHPDRVPPEDRPEADQLFARINLLWREAQDRIKSGLYGTPTPSAKPLTIFTKSASIELGSALPPGEVADFFSATVTETGKPAYQGILKLARHPADNDLLQNEAKVLKALSEVASEADLHFQSYLPDLAASVMVDDGTKRAANLFRTIPGYLSLEAIRASHPGAIDVRHMGWMLNRVFEGLTYVHGKGVVHGAINPAHLLYNPVSHGLIIVGWSAGVTDPSGSNARVSLVSSTYRDFTAPEILAKDIPGQAADFYGAARSMLFALTGAKDGAFPKLPKSIAGFLKACLIKAPQHRIKDALEARREFQDILEALYGPPSYRKLEIGLA